MHFIKEVKNASMWVANSIVHALVRKLLCIWLQRNQVAIHYIYQGIRDTRAAPGYKWGEILVVLGCGCIPWRAWHLDLSGSDCKYPKGAQILGKWESDSVTLDQNLIVILQPQHSSWNHMLLMPMARDMNQNDHNYIFLICNITNMISSH